MEPGREDRPAPEIGVDAPGGQGIQVGAHNVQTNIFPGPSWRQRRPRQLPPSVPHFAGREPELAALTGLLRHGAEAGGSVVVSAIDGTAGVGKPNPEN